MQNAIVILCVGYVMVWPSADEICLHRYLLAKVLKNY